MEIVIAGLLPVLTIAGWLAEYWWLGAKEHE